MGKLAIYKPSRHKHQWFGVCLCPPGKFRSNHAINPVLVSTWNRHKISQYTHVKYSNTSTSYYVHWVCRSALAQTDIIKANRVNHTTYAELKDGKKRWGLFVFWLRVAKDDLSPDNLSFQSFSWNGFGHLFVQLFWKIKKTLPWKLLTVPAAPWLPSLEFPLVAGAELICGGLLSLPLESRGLWKQSVILQLLSNVEIGEE